MPRPKKERIVCLGPNVKCFGPQGANPNNETIEIFCDEIESIKLINLEGLNMAEGGKKMGVSAATFNRILKSAYKKITDAIINGKNLAVKKCK
ncbi:MAG TPA: DUF134 domain-containing protein [Candidatus Absconditabacterales bacterium]|nr:DUF134 domain-containing protein [Candidatus Absconditabacterales bacterium]HPK27699.1 DUF134 domain-containing protein [Candidatus Absconditabacterales bacterium]